METIDVVTVGCGPTGALLSAYLGRYGVKNLVLEREEAVTTDPRGIALDGEGMRCLQGVGASARFWLDVGDGLGRINFISAKPGKVDLQAKPIFSFNADTVGPMGHPHSVSHKQPALEKSIRDVAARYESCELRSGCTVDGISEDEEWVYVTYIDRNQEQKKVRARYLVGADGKTGFTRKKYLEKKGVVMEVQNKLPYEETWVALNWHITPPSPESHPNFPLFKRGFSSEQVYDAFFPPGFRFLCNPERPSVFGRFGPKEERLCRFEFVVNNGEDGWEMAKEDKVMGIVGSYLTHKKEKYGLDEDVMFPTDCIEVLRSRPFKFSARSCNKWAMGRVIICGDAAHVFPPFGGQGIASGFRDAISLAWRLAILTRPTPPPHKPLLEAWYCERKQQLNRSLALTIKNGLFCTASDPAKILIRDWTLWIMQLFPGMKEWLERGARGNALTRYSWSAGLPFLAELRGGVMFPQIYCVPLCVPKGDAKPLLTDDLIFSPSKKGIFQLVVLLNSAKEIGSVLEGLQQAKESFERHMEIGEATVIVDKAYQMATDKANLGVDIVRVFMRDEFDAETSKGFPEPVDYDGGRLRREIKGTYVILRPDRFVFADCMNVREFVVASKALKGMFNEDTLHSRL